MMFTPPFKSKTSRAFSSFLTLDVKLTTLFSSSRSRAMTLISAPGLVDLTVGWVERYLAASSPFEMERQARMTHEALRVMY